MLKLGAIEVKKNQGRMPAWKRGRYAAWIILKVAVICCVTLQEVHGAVSSAPTVHASTGNFKTPNHPSNYDDNAFFRQTIDLQPYESIQLISGTASPSFEMCCDIFTVMVNGTEVLDLREQGTAVGRDWWKYTGLDYPTRVTLLFRSDGSKVGTGLQGTYRISCAKVDLPGKPDRDYGCIYGSCSLRRTPQETKPIVCSCPSGFYGTRCEDYHVTSTTTTLKNATGEIATPNYPQVYDNQKNVSWILQLQGHEEVEFSRTSAARPEFEPNCDFCDTFTMYVDGNSTLELHKLGAGPAGESLMKVEAGSEPKSVEIKFASDGLNNGKGFKLTYQFTCDKRTSDKWCLNGASCTVLNSKSLDRQKLCHCAKGFKGQRCEERIQFTTETIALTKASGIIETPGFPSEYPPGKNITWTIGLQNYEKISISLVEEPQTPSFESCCDHFTLSANESTVHRFSSDDDQHPPQILTGPQDIQFQFVSDGGVSGRGAQVHYAITCENAVSPLSHHNPDTFPCLNHGLCSVARDDHALSPVQCTCPKNFYGPRCENQKIFTTEVIDVHAPIGTMETPNFPNLYPSGANIIWRLKLHEFEKITFQLDVDSGRPDFEECCDTFQLMKGKTTLANFATKTATQQVVILGSASADDGTPAAAKEVTLHFMSDGGVEGKGARITYTISCDDSQDPTKRPCLHGGSCSLSRNGTSSGPVACTCPKKFFGRRCENVVKFESSIVELRNKSGYFQTPNYPLEYPPGLSITWHLTLQPFQVMVIEKAGTIGSDFEECCDTLHLHANGVKTYDFKVAEGWPEGATLETITADYGPIEVRMVFSSDGGINGNGFKGRYTISCIEGRDNDAENACMNGGVCSVDTASALVHCKCSKGFRGPRCKEAVHVSNEVHHFESPTGKVRMPGYPGHYENARNVTWTWNLKPYEVLKLRKLSQHASNLEECCDHLTLVHDQDVHILNDGVKVPGTHDLASIHADKKGIQVSLTFTSDGAINGAGVEIGYTIGCKVSACFDNGTCLVSKTGISGKRCMLDSSCPHSWVPNANKDHCVLLSLDQVDEISHEDVCSQREAKVAEIRGPEDNQIIGMEAKSPLVWIGLSDSQSERDWKWINSGKPPVFANWGPGYPSGQGDFAVMYPNRWTLGECQDKKRFLCETMDPYCPSEWIRPEDGTINRKCYYQSKYKLDFLSAAAMCSMMAPGGHLAHWDGQTALAFGPEQWDCSPGEGLAHFWVGLGKCQPTAGGRRDISDETEVYRLPVVDSVRKTVENFRITAIQTSNNKIGLCGSSMKLQSCGFVYPNAWADFSTSNVDRKYYPTVACERETNFKFQQLESATENETRRLINLFG